MRSRRPRARPGSCRSPSPWATSRTVPPITCASISSRNRPARWPTEPTSGFTPSAVSTTPCRWRLCWTASSLIFRSASMLAEPDLGVGARRRRYRVEGVVQGVGFRPFVFRLASELTLTGFVSNGNGGVTVEVEGESNALERFESRLRAEAPPLSRVSAVRAEEVAACGDDQFVIAGSDDSGERRTAILADAATCSDCLAEIRDPSNRRYRYPFTNCTNCGPRFSIVEGIPYDRANTTMRRFVMCPRCRS